MQEGTFRRSIAGTPQGGVISPLLSNIYLHALDRAFADGAHGRLVRYADDFVVLCRSRAQAEAAQELASRVLAELGLELHPDKTRVVGLTEGREGLDFLGCHFRARVSGRLLERGVRRYYLQRWPSQRAMKRVRQKIQELTDRPSAASGMRNIQRRRSRSLNPVLRGWGNYFRTGNASLTSSVQIDQLRRTSAQRPTAQALRPQAETRPIGDLDARNGWRRTASTAFAALSATRDSRRDHQEDHR